MRAKLRLSVVVSVHWCRGCWISLCRGPEVGRRQNHKKNYWRCPRRRLLVCPLRPAPLAQLFRGQHLLGPNLCHRPILQRVILLGPELCPAQLYPEQNVGGVALRRRRQYALRQKLAKSAPLGLMCPGCPPMPQLPHAPWGAIRRCSQLWKQFSRRAGRQSLQFRTHLGCLTMRRAASCRNSSRSARYPRPVVADARWRYRFRSRLCQMVRSVKSISPRREGRRLA